MSGRPLRRGWRVEGEKGAEKREASWVLIHRTAPHGKKKKKHPHPPKKTKRERERAQRLRSFETAPGHVRLPTNQAMDDERVSKARVWCVRGWGLGGLFPQEEREREEEEGGGEE